MPDTASAAPPDTATAAPRTTHTATAVLLTAPDRFRRQRVIALPLVDVLAALVLVTAIVGVPTAMVLARVVHAVLCPHGH